MMQWLTDGGDLPGGTTAEMTSSLETVRTVSALESRYKTSGAPFFGTTDSSQSWKEVASTRAATTEQTQGNTFKTEIQSGVGGESSSVRSSSRSESNVAGGTQTGRTELTESGSTTRKTETTFMTSMEVDYSGFDQRSHFSTFLTRQTSFSESFIGSSSYSERATITGLSGTSTTSTTSSTSSASTWSGTTSGQTSTTEVSTASASVAGTGPSLGTSTTFICTHTGSTTQTSTFERTQISHSAGVPVTTTVTVTDLTTLDTSYTVSASGTTTVAGAVGGRWHHTVLQADWGRHLFVAPAGTAASIGPALDFYTWSGSRTTLTPEFDTVGAGAGGQTTARTTASSTFSSTDSTATTWGTTSSETKSTFSTQTSAVGALATGYVVSDPYAPSWSFDFPPEGESGAATLSLVGPATLSLTLVPGGTHASSTTTFSAADGATATTTFASGIAVFASGCMANADAGNPPTHGQFKVIEVDCFAGWLPQCS